MNTLCHLRTIWPATCAVLTAALLLTTPHPAAAQPGWVLSHQKINATEGGFTGPLVDFDIFGHSAASLGDLDGDGVADLAVGAPGDRNGGAVWVLFLNPEGTVKAHQKISSTEGGFAGTLDDGDNFGRSVASLGDLDGDGVGDLAVGVSFDDDGGNPPNADHGAVWILFLNTDGTVKAHQKISDTEGGFTGDLEIRDFFGVALASLRDLDGDGVGELAVGANGDDDGGNVRGAVWVLFLNADGTVKTHQKISSTQGGFAGELDDSDYFGGAVASLGDLDGDGIPDLVGAARDDDDGGRNQGAVWVLFLNADGTVKSHQKISGTQGGFSGILDDSDLFGTSVESLGDLDGDGVDDLAVGALADDDGGNPPNADHGAVWILFLNTDGTVKSHQKISDTEGGFTGILHDDDHLGWSVAALGDLDGDGVGELAVGATGDGDRGRGAVWVMFLDGVPCEPCDMNCDGVVDAVDIEFFIELLFDGATPCGSCTGDTNGDGVVDAGDIEGFIGCLFP